MVNYLLLGLLNVLFLVSSPLPDVAQTFKYHSSFDHTQEHVFNALEQQYSFGILESELKVHPENSYCLKTMIGTVDKDWGSIPLSVLFSDTSKRVCVEFNSTAIVFPFHDFP